MRQLLATASLVLIAGCSSMPDAASSASDAPDGRSPLAIPFKGAASYAEALQTWRSAEDVNAWIGARFEYDMSRAILLSETQRSKNGTLPIARPDEFFAYPRGVCVDLSRFAVETLRVVDPQAKPSFLMIEFAPVSIAGNTLRLHWLAAFRHGGSHYFFADSKRPGHIAGPYATTQEFMQAYEKYRGRQIVAFRELASYERKTRTTVGVPAMAVRAALERPRIPTLP